MSDTTEAEGENTDKWAIRNPGFMGSVKQLLCCARCGEFLRGGHNKPRHGRDIFKPTMHFICDDCFNALPDLPPSVSATGGEEMG